MSQEQLIAQQLSLVFSDSATCLAAAHMLSYEVGSQLQKHKTPWELERQRIATTIEQEMERSFRISPEKVQETTARHQQIMDAFLRDIDDRRRAVCRNARRLFLSWLKAASEDRKNSKTTPIVQQQQATTLLNQAQMLPIDFGRQSTTAAADSSNIIKFQIFGSNSSEKISMTVAFSSIEDLDKFLPLVQQHDQVDSRETALRAVGMLSRFVSSSNKLNTSNASNSILFFYGMDKNDFESTCITSIRDFMFDICEENSSSINDEKENNDKTQSRELMMNYSQHNIQEFPLRGLFGANIGISIYTKNTKISNNELREKVQEVIDHCVTMRAATMISIAVSNAMSLAETTQFVSAVFEAIRLTAQDCCTSLRVSTRNGIKIPTAAATTTSSSNSIPFSSPLGASVRLFIPPHKLNSVISAIRREI